MRILEGRGSPFGACGEKHLLGTCHLGEELFARGSLEHSDAYRAEVVDALEYRAGGDVAAAVEDTTALIELADVIVYELT